MNNNKIDKKTIVICGLIVLLFSLLALFMKNKERFVNKNDNKMYKNYERIEKYDVNQYVPIYINESDVVKKYFNDYKNSMINNVNEAYDMLNKDYREKKFGSLDSYQEYIDNMKSVSLLSMELDRYSVTKKGCVKIFKVYDKSGNIYIIKENSIMDYEIYLDNNTVKIE